MASFAANENNAEAGVVKGTGTTGTENEHPSPFSPMTDTSTLQDVDEESTADSGGVSTFQGMLRMKMEHQVDHYPEGLPRLAAEQNAWHTGSFFRAFGYLSKRLTRHLEGRVANLKDQLDELDATSDKHLKGLTAGQRRKAGEEYTPDACDIIMDELREAEHHYFRSVLYDREIQKLGKPAIEEVVGLYIDLKGRGAVDEDALSFMREPDDFVSTRPSEDHTDHFRSLVYSPWGWWVRRFLSPDGEGRWEVEFKALLWLQGIVMFLLCTFMMLGPVEILYLAPLSRVESFMVVVVFVGTFGAAMLLPKHPKTKFRDILVVVFAYAAVLSAFLAQMG